MSNSSQPLVSFCFTTFKRREYLKSTLTSILRQTVGDFEVVVSDNDPEQSGREVVEGMDDPRFLYFPNETNLGMKKSFNQSLKRSTGQYIVMIADDDPVYPEMLETLLNAKDHYPGFGMYLGGSNWYCTDPAIARLYNLKVGMNSFLASQPVGTVTAYSPSEFLKQFFSMAIFPSYLWSTAIVRREVLLEMGGIPDYGTAFLGDYAYLSIMGSHSGCVVINTALGHQTIHTQNFGRDQNDQIRTAAVNFTEYVTSKISQVPGWPEIQEKMQHFVAMWVVSHLSFLHDYFRLSGNESNVDLRPIEKAVFAVPFIKKHHFKYWLKVHSPGIHDLIVVAKHKLAKK
jgi:glycosyltransferase involved in cell wall biosynthesis